MGGSLEHRAAGTPTRARSRSAPLLVLGVLVASTAVLFLFDPAGHRFYPPCLFHALTGAYCPGCGSLRAVHQLLHGRLLAAVDLNPLAVACLPFVGYALVSQGMLALRGRGLRAIGAGVAPAYWTHLLLGMIVAFWVMRNIPAQPFSWLAP